MSKEEKKTTGLEEYESKTLLDLCKDINTIAQPQFDFAYDNFKNLLSTDIIKRVDKIIVSGCGDSHLAGVEAVQVFKKYLAETGCTMVAPSIIEASRYVHLEENEPNTMIVAVSASGSPARVAELLERGNKHGCITVSLTNNPKSRAAGLADYVYLTNTASDSPGLKSYFASQVSLFVMAAVLGEVKTGKTGLVSELRTKLLEYNAAFFENFDEIANLCRTTANTWQDMRGFEVIADGPLFACGQFIAAKYMEAAGEMCTVIDSENYMHVNDKMRPLGVFGTIIMGISDEDNIERVVNTTNTLVSRDKRSVLFVSNKLAEEVGVTEEVISCQISVPEKDYRFLMTLYAFIPGALMAGYQAQLKEEPYFRGGPGNFKDKSIFTVGTSEIKVI